MPSSETPLVYLFVTDPKDTLKMLRETLCVAQSAIGQGKVGGSRHDGHIERIGRLIVEIDRQRPLGPDGKHRDLHTPFCGCEDKGKIHVV